MGLGWVAVSITCLFDASESPVFIYTFSLGTAHSAIGAFFTLFLVYFYISLQFPLSLQCSRLFSNFR